MKQNPGYLKPSKLYVMTTATIFLGEVIVMFVLAALPPFSVVIEAVVDGMMISALMMPSLYYFLYRPMTSEISRRRTAEGELRLLNRDLEETVQKKSAEKLQTDDRLKKVISEKRQARDEIWRDREFVRSLVEAAPCLFLIYDVQARRCVFGNRQVEDLLGYAAEEVLESGRDFLSEAMTPEDYSAFLEGSLEPDEPSTKNLGHIAMRIRSGEWKQMTSQYTILRRNPEGEAMEVLLTAIERGA